MPGGLPGAPTAAVTGGGEAGGIEWLHDLGAAQAAAKSASKPILLYFVADGNRLVARYDKEFFPAPAVRAALDRYILVRADFPTNTKLAYRFNVFGAGAIVIIDAEGTKIATLSHVQVPQGADQLAQWLANPQSAPTQ